MNRTVGFERTYWLGQYQTSKVIDSFIDIPEELMLDEDFIRKVRLLQFIESERSYRKYQQIKEAIEYLNLEEALAKLEEEKHKTMNDLKEIIKNKGE